MAVRVRDTGIGIAPEMLPRVFDLFMQVDRSIEKAQGGLGVGLTLVRTLLEMHGGAVEVRSDGPGQGSEFLIGMPLAPAHRPSQGEDKSQATSPASLPMRRILVVDDNVDAAQSLAMLLRILGQDVRTAHNGQSALEAARASMPEVAILDLGMPGMNGHELARRLRNEPGGNAVLIVALTGWGQEKDSRRAAESGFDCHMTKPAQEETLHQLLSQVR